MGVPDKMEISCAVLSEFSASVDSLSAGLSTYSTSDSSVDSSVESSEVDGFTATGIDFYCLVHGLGTGFGFSCGISCSLINSTAPLTLMSYPSF